MNINKTAVAKFVTSTIVGAGTMHVTDGIIKNNVNLDDLNSFGKFTVAASKVVVGMMAARQTKQFTDAEIDALVANWQSVEKTDMNTDNA